LITQTSPRVLLLGCSASPGFEYTSINMLNQWEENWRAANVELWVAALNPEATELVQRTSLFQPLGGERMFFTVEQAVHAFEARRTAPSRYFARRRMALAVW
jgi:hypothetical protein